MASTEAREKHVHSTERREEKKRFGMPEASEPGRRRMWLAQGRVRRVCYAQRRRREEEEWSAGVPEAPEPWRRRLWIAQRRVRRVCEKHRGEEKRKNARAKRQCWGGRRDEPTSRDGNPEIPRSDTSVTIRRD